LAFCGVALTVGLTACQSQAPDTTPQAGNSPGQSGDNISAQLSGAGATFPAPLYQRWFSEYNKENPGVQISYQSVGSGAGIKQFLSKTVDFGATDAPLKDDERSQYPKDRGSAPVQIPMTGGAVVMAYNLQGVDKLNLSRSAYCGIVQGDIKNWNDPKIAKDNSGANLPNTPINFVHRSDGSGTTFIFTSHLKAACPSWKAGASKSVDWPVGIGAKGNEGVTAQVQQTEGAIGYTEYSYAKENDLKFAALQNKAGTFIDASPESAGKALAGTTVPENLVVSVADPQQADAYPIVALTYLLLYQQYDDPNKAKALQNFVKWALSNGQQSAEELGYVALPEDLQNKVISAIDTIKVVSASAK
jgi:phosphate transport system substrate-binding protein